MSDDTSAPGLGDPDYWPYDPEYQDTYREVVQRSPGPPTPFREFTVGMIDRVWSRPGLSMRDRRLIVLSILAVSSAPRELAVHLRGAVLAGDLTVEEIDELSLQVAMYGGWPKAAMVQTTLAQLKEELDLDDGASAE